MHYYDIHTHYELMSPSVTRILNLIPGQTVPESFFSVGIHPWYAEDTSIADLQKYIPNPKCVAIGECGLDSMKSALSLTDQKILLHAHLELARKCNKPVILHVVRCTSELFQSLKDFAELTYIWHGFTGNAELVKQFEKRNMYFSIGPSGLKKTETCVAVPNDRLLCETDDSDISIQEIYSSLAAIKNESVEKLADTIKRNVISIFGHELE